MHSKDSAERGSAGVGAPHSDTGGGGVGEDEHHTRDFTHNKQQHLSSPRWGSNLTLYLQSVAPPGDRRHKGSDNNKAQHLARDLGPLTHTTHHTHVSGKWR